MAVIQAAANVAMAAQAAISFTAPECNTVGAALMGGHSLSEAFQAVREGRADTVIILENDLYRRAPAAQVDSFLNSGTRDRPRSPRQSDHRKSRADSAGRNLRRIRRHFRQQRRTGSAILPGLCSTE